MTRVVCLALLIGACSSVPKKPIRLLVPTCNVPVKLYVDKNAPTMWRAYMVVATNFWNREAGKTVLDYSGQKDLSKYDVTNRPPFVGVRQTTDAELEMWPKKRNGFAVHNYKLGKQAADLCNNGSILLVRHDGRLNEETTFLVILHELGHALGLGGHSKAKWTIMYKEVGKVTKKVLCPEYKEYIRDLY